MNASSTQSVEETALDYVLGFADAEERARIEQAMQHQGDLAQAVQEWHLRLIPLVDTIPPVAPPATVWHALEKRIAPHARTASVRVWWTWGPGLAVAASLLFMLLWQPYRPVSHLTLKAADGTVLATAEIDKGNVMRLHPVAMPPAPPGKSYELWIIPAGMSVPRAEGVMPDDPKAQIKLAEAEPGATLAVSVELVGGSPGGLPTGPVVASGTITRI